MGAGMDEHLPQLPEKSELLAARAATMSMGTVRADASPGSGSPLNQPQFPRRNLLNELHTTKHEHVTPLAA